MTVADNFRVYSNGAIFDKSKGRIVALKPELATKNTQITSERTSEMLAIRLEKKRQRVRDGANAVVAEGGKFDGNDLDFVEAVAEVQTIIALNPDSIKATQAADWLMRESGLSDKDSKQEAQQSTMGDVAGIIGALTAFIDACDNSNYRNHTLDSVIDATPSTDSTATDSTEDTDEMRGEDTGGRGDSDG